MLRKIINTKLAPNQIKSITRALSWTNSKSRFNGANTKSYTNTIAILATIGSLLFMDQRKKQSMIIHAEEKASGRLKDKVAIVTGASTGIGEAIAIRFVQEGARVLFIDISPDGAQTVAKLNKENGKEVAMYIKADISKEKEVEAFVDKAYNKWGRVDIMVNNAALFIFQTFDGTVDEWTRSFNVNVMGTMLCTRYASRAMKKGNRGGSIINLSSVSAFEGTPNFACYAMTKGAIMQMTRDFACDLGPHNIRVNAICPGTIFTSATKRDLARQGMTEKEFSNLHSAKTYLNRIGSVEEVGGAAVFLASDDSSFVTGSPIFVDGGRESKF